MPFWPSWLSAGSIIAPVMILLVVVALFAIVRIVSRNYIRVAPNEVLVIYGRKYKTRDGGRRGFRLVTGGAALCIPLLESYRRLPLDAFQAKLAVKNVPSEEGVRVTVNAVASLKIGREDEMLEAAVSRFLNRTLPEIQLFAQEVLEGGLRGVVATMTVEQLVKERTKFGTSVQEGVTGDLAKLGLILDNFLIQDIADELGYIDALGVKRTAQVKRDAAISEAEARRDENIQVAEAQRQADEKSSAARRIGETAKAEADKAISDASRDRDTRMADNAAQVGAQQARISIAAQIAAAEEDKKLRVTRVAAEEAEIEARTELQLKEQKRKDAELDATIIVQATREKEATIIKADAQREAAIITAEGAKRSVIIKAEGDRQSVELSANAERIMREQEAEGARIAAERAAAGRKAQAAAQQAEMEAEAKGNQAKLTADAEGRKAQAAAQQATLQAEAVGIQAKLEAEAQGILKKAEAYTKLDQAGKLLLILEHLPTIIDELGKAIREAGEGTIAPIGQAIGTGLASVEEIRIVDLGGGAGNGHAGSDPLSRFMGAVPATVFDIVQKASGLGVQEVVEQLAKRAGVDLSSVLSAKPDHAPGKAVKPVVVPAEKE